LLPGCLASCSAFPFMGAPLGIARSGLASRSLITCVLQRANRAWMIGANCPSQKKERLVRSMHASQPFSQRGGCTHAVTPTQAPRLTGRRMRVCAASVRVLRECATKHRAAIAHRRRPAHTSQCYARKHGPPEPSRRTLPPTVVASLLDWGPHAPLISG
jgi:hypothetical protein